MVPLYVRYALGSVAAFAAILFLAPHATALSGTGVEIQVDPAGDTTSAGMVGWDMLRIGGQTTNMGSTSNQGDLIFHVKVNTFNSPTAPVCPDCPRKPVSTDFPTGTQPPGYMITFSVNGHCYSVKPWNSPAGSVSWANRHIWKDAPCSNSPPGPTAWTGVTQVLNVVQASWVCNEARIAIPRAHLFVNPGTPPVNGDLVAVLGLWAVGSTITTNIPVYDNVIVNGTVGVYTLGQNGPSENPTALTATYVAPPYPPSVVLDWNAPLAGNDVTGYRVERRTLPGGVFSTIATIGPVLNPPTTFTDTPVWNANDYEYRVTALRCNDLSVGGGSLVASVTVPQVPPVRPAVYLDGPGIAGILGPGGEVQTAQGSCLASHIDFFDISESDNPPITSQSWDFGDGSPIASGPFVSHTYMTPGPKSVTLTVTDSALQSATHTFGVMSLGDPNCCPVLNPLQDYLVFEGHTLQFQATANDPDGGPVSFFLTQLGRPLPPHTFNPTTGFFTWDTAVGHRGAYPVQVTVYQETISMPYNDACRDDLMIMLRVVGTEGTQDSDSDGIPDFMDVCAHVPDHDQVDTDHDGLGDACDLTPCGAEGEACPTAQSAAPKSARRLADQDRDGIPDALDNCAATPNNAQTDQDGDGQGDTCDLDLDGDGILNTQDNCPKHPNRLQVDLDLDGFGDDCQDDPPVGASGIQRPGGNAAPATASENASFRGMEWAALTFAMVLVGALLLAAYIRRK